MAFWLLLGLLYLLALSFFFLYPPEKSLSPVAKFAAIGFIFLSLGLGAELALGFDFNVTALRLFYLARLVMPLAWIGHALLAFALSEWKQTRWLSYGLLAASLAAIVLVGRTGISAAEAWFDPAQPVHGQYAETLATNRPTRALLPLFNGYGALAVLTFSILRRSNLWQDWRHFLGSTALLSGTGGWLWLFLFPPRQLGLWMYVGEWLPALLLCVGFFVFLQDFPEKTLTRQSRHRQEGKAEAKT